MNSTADTTEKNRFGFTRSPFSQSTGKPFVNEALQKETAKLERFLGDRGFAVVTGQAGTGKTLLLRTLCGRLNTNQYNVIYIPFATLTPPDMLKTVCRKLEIAPSISTSRMLCGIQHHINDCGTTPVLILDEIQKISHETLEIIRLMTNFNFEEKHIFSIIMAGNDEFLQQLRLAINTPLRQRITCYCHLEPLGRTDTSEYIQHRISEAGVHHRIIPEETASLVYDCTSGVPRLINTLLGNAIRIAEEQQSGTVTAEHINSAREFTFLPEREVTK